MAAPQVVKQIDFSKGIFAAVNRYQQPPGTIRYVSNWIYSKNGALQTVDGSLIQSSVNGTGPVANQPPIRFIGRYAQTGQSPYLYALQPSGTNVLVIDVSATSWSGTVLTLASSYTIPSFVQAGDFLAFALGAGFTPVLAHNRPLTTVTWANTWTAGTNIPSWIANVQVAVGQPVQPTTPNGHIYVAINDEGAPAGSVTGQTGSTQPTFPTASGARVTDGTVVWQESGATGPPIPPGAAFFFFHLGFLWAWGTNTTYTADGLDGPDALRMSDLYNFTSWNPLNQTFIGKGDGTLPTGGGVMTLGETGIAATAQLVLFKQNSSYVVLGALGPNAQAKKVPTGVGCVAPGTVFFIEELGLIRLSARGVAVFDGQNDNVEQYTDPIDAYLFGGLSDITPIDWSNVGLCKAARANFPPCYLLACPLPAGSTAQVGTQSVTAAATTVSVTFPSALGGSYAPYIMPTWDTTVYVSGLVSTGFTVVFGTPAPAGGGTVYWAASQQGAGLTRMFVYHLSLQAWAVVDLPWPIATLAYIPENPFPSFTLTGGQMDGTVRRIFAGDPDWDGTAILGSLTLPEIGNPVSPSYVKEVSVSGRAKLGLTCGFTGATLQWINRAGLIVQESLFAAPSQIPVHVTIDRTMISGSLQLSSTGPMILEGIEIPVRPKPYTKIAINRDGGNTTLNPPNSYGAIGTTTSFLQGTTSVSAGASTVGVTIGAALTSGNFFLTIATTWDTTFWVVSQNTANFLLAFGTPAPVGGGSVFWSLTVASASNRVGQTGVIAGAVTTSVSLSQATRIPYTPAVATNWNTTVSVTSITGVAFTVIFGTPAPMGGGILYFNAEQPQ